MSKPSDLVQGTLDLVLLKILALEPLNGFAISLRLKQVSSDILQVSDGSRYPALHKLEQEGWIASEWKPSENNRRAKFYSLTRLDRKQLAKVVANWTRLSDSISHAVRIKEASKNAPGTLVLHHATTATLTFPPTAGRGGAG
jgi:PadR family transcriptional regulator PadR